MKNLFQLFRKTTLILIFSSIYIPASLAGPAYTPEMGFTVAGGIMISYKTNPKDSLIQRSSSPVMLGVTSTGGIFASTILSSCRLEDKLRIYGDFVYKDMPDNYYGVGYDHAFTTPESDSTKVSEPSQGVLQDEHYQELDFRKYWSIKEPGRTIALQAMSRLSFGDMPYGEMSQLGTPFDLRGYKWGQYRENSMLFFIGEYRHTFLKKDQTLSKHGVAGWLGTGSIGKDPSEFTHWLPNVGVGYRLEVQPRMNLRIDIGIGRESAGFYFNFNEAF
jgi:hypothetical protein